MTTRSKSQSMAQTAFARIVQRKPTNDYESFARRFPALVHSCGLAQAVQFALAKRDKNKSDGGPSMVYLADLAAVLEAAGHTTAASEADLAKQTRDMKVSEYLRLSRDALLAADWLKRYVEATDAPAAAGRK